MQIDAQHRDDDDDDDDHERRKPVLNWLLLSKKKKDSELCRTPAATDTCDKFGYPSRLSILYPLFVPMLL